MKVVNASTWQFSHFDPAHLARVRAARKAQGLSHCGDGEGLLDNHKLIGRQLTDSAGTVHTVVAVQREWCQGYATSLHMCAADGVQSRGYVRGTGAFHAPLIDAFIARFPADADEIIASA